MNACTVIDMLNASIRLNWAITAAVAIYASHDIDNKIYTMLFFITIPVAIFLYIAKLGVVIVSKKHSCAPDPMRRNTVACSQEDNIIIEKTSAGKK